MPVRVVEEKENIHMIHDLTLKGSRNGVGGEPRRSVDVKTDWAQVLGRELGGVLDVTLKRVIGLRANFEVDARNVYPEHEYKECFPANGGRLGRCEPFRVPTRPKCLFGDFRLRFRWRGSPG